MDHPPPLPAQGRANLPGRAPAALVALLHGAGGVAFAQELVRAWVPLVPAAAVVAVPADGPGRAADAQGAVGRLLRQAGLPASSLVLAGAAGGEGAALHLAFGPGGLACAGVVACGDGLPPLRMLGGCLAPHRARLRLVWTAEDPLFCAAALGGLLRCLRAAGLDAQGAVLPREDRPSRGAGGYPAACRLHPPLVHLGGAYVAELVAVALASASCSPSRPAGTG